ncbi:MAG: hypothetical protein WCX32_03570 [Clostridia bacterium]|jgi:hypothetical protein|nr:hypothetical protein [Clostridia bacterium]MDD4275605.1 hypothetical protein [Clostridia bacterium]
MFKITQNEKGYLNVLDTISNKLIFNEGFDHKTTELEIIKVNEKEKAIKSTTFIDSNDSTYDVIYIYALNGQKIAQALDGHRKGEPQGKIEIIDTFKCNLQFEEEHFYFHYKKSAIPIPKEHNPHDREFIVFDYKGKVLFSAFDCANFKNGIVKFEESKDDNIVMN